MIERCESPIERALCKALLLVIEREGSTLRIETQVRIGRYRADIVISDRAGPVLVVECDGHEFHERTKEQAARDRRRDRDILSMHGVVTVRFTGSEIHQDPEDCAFYCLCVAQELSFQLSLASVGQRVVAG